MTKHKTKLAQMSLEELRAEYRRLYPQIYGPKGDYYAADQADDFEIIGKMPKKKLIAKMREVYKQLNFSE